MLVILAENQAPSAQALDRLGVARCVGRIGAVSSKALSKEISTLAFDRERRLAMGMAGRQLIDGVGAPRTVAVIQRIDARRASATLPVEEASSL